ncbi:MAG: hypothetical protein Q8P28_07370 [Deltaproteobacteria bacterium]|nr:hypothetical protein [Deltaproteobacteria bacterium]
MINCSGQWLVVSGQKLKKILVFFLLFTLHYSLSTVVMGCGKKAPPKPPAESVSQ